MTLVVIPARLESTRLPGKPLALIHGVLSFCFNTIILALTINTISGLL